MVTWIYDETGNAAAILDEFCIRSLDGVPQAWLFGVSVFSIRGEHIGWFEHGVLFDVDNDKLGFVEGALGLIDAPQLHAPPPIPVFGKRPCVPALRARRIRPQGTGWSAEGLAEYLDERACAPRFGAAGVMRAPAARTALRDASR